MVGTCKLPGHLLTSNGLTVHENLAGTWWGHCVLVMLWFPTSQPEKLIRTQLWTEYGGRRPQTQQHEAVYRRPGKSTLQQKLSQQQRTRKVLQSFLKPAVTSLPSLLAGVDLPGTGRLPKQTVRAPMSFPTNESETAPSYCWWGSDLIL